jgi:transposase InsO family protein
VSDSYEFINGCEDAYPIIKTCTWLEVSRSGYYEWRGRPASATTERRTELTDQIVELFEASDETYGYRRVHRELGREGVQAGPELVRGIMRREGLVACQPRPRRHSLTVSGGGHPVIPDLVARRFDADAPGVKLVGDITCIPTWDGWLYLATVIDCHTRAVIGYAMGEDCQTPLIDAAIDMAARDYRLDDECIFHSDRGSNYTSAATLEPRHRRDHSASILANGGPSERLRSAPR